MSTSAQGLSHKAPVHRSASAPLPTRVYSATVTVAGVVPTNTEIATALASAFSDTPRAGDIVALSVSSVLKFRSTITLSGTASGIWCVAFTVSSVTYYGHQTQTGLY